MNTIEWVFMELQREFPRAEVALYAPDDEENATWSILASQGDDVLTIEWHAGLELMGISHAARVGVVPDELVSVFAATQMARGVLHPREAASSGVVLDA